jgi:hypothetical protein
MEIPKKQSAKSTFMTLKECLNSKAYLKALDRMIQIERNSIKNNNW